MDLKKESYELLPLDRNEVPADVIKIVESDGDSINEMQRFRARNWRKKVSHGFAFSTEKVRIFTIEEDCTLHQNGKTVPAWGITITSGTIANSVDKLFCHTMIQISLTGYNVAKD